MTPKPVYKLLNFCITPHPARKVVEYWIFGESLGCGRAPNEAVDSASVGPVTFDANNVEAMFFNQAFSDGGSGAVEFGYAMVKIQVVSTSSISGRYRNCDSNYLASPMRTVLDFPKESKNFPKSGSSMAGNVRAADLTTPPIVCTILLEL